MRCSSKDSCSVVDSSKDSFTVVPFALVSSSEVMSCVFSRMLPVEVARVSSKVFSSPASCTLRSSSTWRRWLFCFSSSGCSC